MFEEKYKKCNRKVSELEKEKYSLKVQIGQKSDEVKGILENRKQ